MSYLDISSMDVTTHQAEQLEIATSSAVGCFTGAAGCGKTWVVGQILGGYKGDAVVVTPTGKAASRVREMFPNASARTVYSALEPGRSGKDGDGWSFNRNRSNPLTAGLIICEEWSMADAAINCSLLNAVSRGTKILFVGDPFRQLSPVGRGKPFIDYIHAGVPHGSLTELHRFAGRIARVCNDIADGKIWQGSDKLDLEAVPKENFIHVECSSQRTLVSIKGFVEQFMDKGYSLDEIQILCPCNTSGDLSREKINGIMQKWFNPNGEEILAKWDKGNEHKIKCKFSIGDKIICLSNQDAKLQPHGTDVEPTMSTYVANGDTGVIVDTCQHNGKIHVVCDMPSGRCIFELAEFRKDFTLAYAITGHKSQGSQWPVVIVVADESNGARMVTDRSWYYTAYSRASEICCSVGSRSAILSNCRTARITHRKTFLAQEILRLNPKNALST
jgi:exodeoxyribonuclease V alpha subunit